jgi:hypothetical protein
MVRLDATTGDAVGKVFDSIRKRAVGAETVNFSCVRTSDEVFDAVGQQLVKVQGNIETWTIQFVRPNCGGEVAEPVEVTT